MPLLMSSIGMFETLFTPTNVHEVTLKTWANKNVLFHVKYFEYLSNFNSNWNVLTTI
jgi:hypothetical protein